MMLVVGWFLNFRAARLFEDLKLFFKVSIPSRIGLRRYSVCPYGAADSLARRPPFVDAPLKISCLKACGF